MKMALSVVWEAQRGVSVILTGVGFLRSVFLPEDEKSARSSRTHTGQTALRDADQSPRVGIPLPGGDCLLLCPPLTCSSVAPPGTTMVTFFFNMSICRAERYIKLRFQRDYWLFIIIIIIIHDTQRCLRF